MKNFLICVSLVAAIVCYMLARDSIGAVVREEHGLGNGDSSLVVESSAPTGAYEELVGGDAVVERGNIGSVDKIDVSEQSETVFVRVLTGRARLIDGVPISHETLQVSLANEAGSAVIGETQTSENGNFKIVLSKGVATGERMVIRHLIPQLLNLNEVFEVSEFDAIDYIADGGLLPLKVLGEDGEPVCGVEVKTVVGVYSEELGKVLGMSNIYRTDRDGVVRVYYLDGVDALLSIGFAASDRYYSETLRGLVLNGSNLEYVINLTGSAEVGSLKVDLLNQNGDRIYNFSVKLSGVGSVATRSLLQSEPGHYGEMFYDIPPGLYRVNVGRRYKLPLSTYFPDTATSKEVSVSSGKESVVRFDILEGARVQIELTGSDEAPARYALEIKYTDSEEWLRLSSIWRVDGGNIINSSLVMTGCICYTDVISAKRLEWRLVDSGGAIIDRSGILNLNVGDIALIELDM